jgi:hypothetical protein
MPKWNLASHRHYPKGRNYRSLTTTPMWNCKVDGVPCTWKGTYTTRIEAMEVKKKIESKKKKTILTSYTSYGGQVWQVYQVT